ncbi:MAG: arylesterase [Acidisphaera sp.]|nr:arylesterase [Acidisphaera sp.]
MNGVLADAGAGGAGARASIAAAYGPHRPPRKALRWIAAALLTTVSALAGAANAAPIRILALGDSLTAGYGLPHDQGFEQQLQAALRARGDDVQILDGGVSGDTSAGGLARLDWALADRPDAAIVELGGNDGLRGIDPKATQANLAAILDHLAERRIPVLLSGMYAPPNLGRDYGQQFRAVFDRLGGRPGILYDPFYLADVATIPTLNQPDGIHPNAEGVSRIVARLVPMVERLIREVPAR